MLYEPLQYRLVAVCVRPVVGSGFRGGGGEGEGVNLDRRTPQAKHIAALPLPPACEQLPLSLLHAGA